MVDNDKNKLSKTNDMLIKETGLTYEDYVAINDNNRYELASGQLVLMSPAPSVIHQIVSAELLEHFKGNCKPDYFIIPAPVDVILSSTEVRQPDIVLVHRNRIDILRKRGVEGAPDLVVEILSPSSLKRDKIDKLNSYAFYNIPEYWIVEPTSGILEQYILHESRYELHNIFQGDELVTSPTISSVSFTMSDIMDNIPDIKD